MPTWYTVNSHIWEREKKNKYIWKQTIDFSLDGLAIDKLKMILATKMSRIIAEA